MAPMEARWIASLRKWLIPKAWGTVLEIGTGTGANLPYYRMNQLQQLVLTDRKGGDPEFSRIIQARIRDLIQSRDGGIVSHPSIPLFSSIQYQVAEAEDLPFSNGQFDTVVASLLLCSVESPRKAIAEIRRVLREGGQFLFIEHVLPSTPVMASLFHRITPAWRRIASGCHLNRDTVKTIEEGGFSVLEMRRPGNSVFVGGVALRSGLFS